MCNLTGSITDYHNVAQGKTTIPNVDDGEECLATDVRINFIRLARPFLKSFLDSVMLFQFKSLQLVFKFLKIFQKISLNQNIKKK